MPQIPPKTERYEMMRPAALTITFHADWPDAFPAIPVFAGVFRTRGE